MSEAKLTVLDGEGYCLVVLYIKVSKIDWKLIEALALLCNRLEVKANITTNNGAVLSFGSQEVE